MPTILDLRFPPKKCCSFLTCPARSLICGNVPESRFEAQLGKVLFFLGLHYRGGYGGDATAATALSNWIATSESAVLSECRFAPAARKVPFWPEPERAPRRRGPAPR